MLYDEGCKSDNDSDFDPSGDDSMDEDFQKLDDDDVKPRGRGRPRKSTAATPRVRLHSFSACFFPTIVSGLVDRNLTSHKT